MIGLVLWILEILAVVLLAVHVLVTPAILLIVTVVFTLIYAWFHYRPVNGNRVV